MKLIKHCLLFVFVTCALRGEIVSSKSLLGEGRVAIIEKAANCSAELITSEIVALEDDCLVYKIVAKGDPRELSSVARDTLRGALLKDWNDDGVRYGCKPLPGVRYIFRHGSESVSLIVCYRCNSVIVEENGKAVAGRPGKDIADQLRNVAGSFLTADEVRELP